MLKADTVFAFVIALLCGVYLLLSWQMGVGSIEAPEAGLIPVLFGAMGLISSLLIVATSFGSKKSTNNEKIPKQGLLRLIGCLVASVLFIPAFEFLGTIISIFILVLALTKIFGDDGWLRPIVLAAASTIAAYFLFFHLLDVPLPQGIFL